MKNENRFLTRFVADYDERRQALHNPIDMGEYVIATDIHILARVRKDLCEETYQSNETFKKIPNYFNDGDTFYTLNLDDIVATVNKIPKVEIVKDKRAKCDECNGSGDVDWEYEDSEGYLHQRSSDCPICGGTGRVDQKKLYRENQYVEINGVLFLCAYLMDIADAMNDLGVKMATVRNLHKTRAMYINLIDGVDIILMPLQEGTPAQKMKLNPISK